MPVTTINPNNAGTIKLGTTASPTLDYGCQVVNFALTPTVNTTERPGTYCAPPLTRNTKSSWQIEFEYLQDWGAAQSISAFMFLNDGKLVFFEFAPTVAGVPKAAGSFYATAGAFGGDAGTTWVSTGTCPVEGVPTLTPTPTGLAADTEDIDADADDDADSE